MVIDIHAHLGWDYTYDEDFPKYPLVDKLKKLKVDIQIVQPGNCHGIDEVINQHNSIAKLCNEYPGHFFGMANPNPHLDEEEYQNEISRCIEDLGFIGIKLHTLGFAVIPGSKSGRKAFDAAKKYGVPLMVHTGVGIPFAGPVNLIKLAKEYKDVKIIMAHCGQIILANEATAVFDLCPKVYGDTSWTPGFMIKEWIKSYGPRFMLI